MEMKAWKEVCRPKENGSLGFRRFHDMNHALLSKLSWKIAT